MQSADDNPQPGSKRVLNYYVVIVILILLAVFLNIMKGMEKDIEKAGVYKAVSEINASLAVFFYSYVVQGKIEELQKYHGGNPFGLLASNFKLPLNYFGIVQNKSQMTLDGGWYFNLNSNELIYRSAHGLGELSYSMVFKYIDNNQSNYFEMTEDELVYFRLDEKKPAE